jgi:hypothetical protein
MIGASTADDARGARGTAYQDVGNARSVAVVNSPLDVLRRETDQTHLIGVKVSTMGTAPGAALLHEAHEPGARGGLRARFRARERRAGRGAECGGYSA